MIKKIKKYLPLEVYFLLTPSALLFLFSVLYLKSFSIDAFGIKEFLNDSFGGTAPFAIFFPIILWVLLISVVFKTVFFVMKKNPDRKKPATINLKQVLSVFFILLLLSFEVYSLGLFTGLLFRVADPAKTAKFGNIALSWDKAIFNTDPGIWLIKKLSGTFLEAVLLFSYNSIFLMLSLVLLFSFFLKKNAFRRLVLSFFISWIIAFPIWFLFPVIPPDFMFRLNKLNLAGLAENKAFNNFIPSTQLKDELSGLEKIHIINQTPAQRSLPVSTFPSMHAAWGVLITYAGIVLWPWLGVILVPWAVLNGIGAVYVLEHYSVDIFLGVIIAFISIVITELLLRLEDKYFEDKFGLLSIFDYVYIKTVLHKFANQTGLRMIFKKIHRHKNTPSDTKI